LTNSISDNSGFTLLELLISITILSIIMVGLHQVMSTAISAYDITKDKQELLAQARFAMERMAMFAQEADDIDIPSGEQLKVTERLLDTYNNSDQTYMPGGDGYLDADNDSDGIVNEGAGDSSEYIDFRLNKDDPSNWKLVEEMPDYGTASPGDTMAEQVLCEHVTDFTLTLLAANLAEIQLTLNDGESGVSLMTRVKAMNVD
jgi:prepilin-type N-terminal cleavage/methylation domain-containing protein